MPILQTLFKFFTFGIVVEVGGRNSKRDYINIFRTEATNLREICRTFETTLRSTKNCLGPIMETFLEWTIERFQCFLSNDITMMCNYCGVSSAKKCDKLQQGIRTVYVYN